MREALLDVLAQTPRAYGIKRTRWRLQDRLQVIKKTMTVNMGCISTLHKWCQRLGISYRHGWEHIVSPDAQRALKLSVIEHVLELARTQPAEVVVLWLDELTVYRLPSTAQTWGATGGRPTKARLTSGENNALRIGGP